MGQRIPNQTANFVTKNQAAIDKIIEASQLPACVPFLSADSKTRGEEEWALKNMALINSHHQLLKSNLTAAKVSIDAYDRIYQRTDYIVLTNRHTAGYYNFLIDWADHPDQTLDAIQSAIAKLEGSDTDIWPSKIVLADDKVLEPQSPTGLNISRLYWEFGGERGLMNLQEVVANLQQNNHHYLIGLKESYRLFPWEYQRQLKVGQLRAIREFDRNQAFLDTYSVGNDQLITTWPNVYISAGSQHNVITDAHWRRYTLLRLGLAAYKIEHEKYPDDLLQLKSYYKYGFPKTTRGLMYPWFKDGIGSDLIKASYEDIQFGELKSARKIASGKSPLLLPFSLDPATSLPQPIDYGQGKLGIDINRLYVNQPEFLFYCGHTLYKTSWAVGAKD